MTGPPDPREVLEQLPLPHLTFDSNLKLTAVNAAGRSLFKLEEGQLGQLDATWFFREEIENEKVPLTGDGSASTGSAPRRTKEDDLESVREELLALANGAGEGRPAWVWERSNGSVIHLWAPDELGIKSLKTCIAVVQTTSAASSPATPNRDTSKALPPSPHPQASELTSPPPTPNEGPSFTLTLLQSLPSAPSSQSTQRLRRPTISTGSLNTTYLSSPSTVSGLSSPSTSRTSKSIAKVEATKDEIEDAPKALGTILSTYTEPGSRNIGVEAMEDLLNHLPQICFTASPQGQLTYLNKQWYKYTGLAEDESFDIGNWTDLFHPDDLAGAVVAFTHSIATGEPLKMEYRIKAADGSWHWHVASGNALKDAEGNVTQWVSVITDVEELVQVRSDALKAREHITAVLHGADLVLLTVDRDLNLTFIEGSSRALSFTSAKPTSLDDTGRTGQNIRGVWPDPGLHAEISKMLNEAEVWEERHMLHSDLDTHGPEGTETQQTRSFRYRLVPLEGVGPDGRSCVTGIIVVCADITELVKAETDLRTSNEERTRLLVSENAAKEASRLKTEFVTNTSHELRTPITAILGIFELLLDDDTLKKEHKSLVKKGVRSAEILLDLVGMVLDLGKVEAGRLIIEKLPFHISEAAEDAALFSVAAHKKGISFTEDFGKLYDGMLLGDKMRLRQVLANGLSNAVKFTQKGGIILRIHQDRESPFEVLISIIIEDTGIGIGKGVLPKLFSPFMQADAGTARQYGGSGLGLVITKNLVELMGGTVKLESIPGQGSRMSIFLPFEKAPRGVESASATGGASPRASPRVSPTATFPVASRNSQDVHILLAEDNTLVREIVTKTLVKMGFQVDSVEDGEKAVEAVQKTKYDLILMDNNMPVQDGLEATRAIRRLSDPIVRKIKIIALTASALQGDKDRCLQAGMDSYLSKPVRAKDLEAAIWQQLA